MTSDIDLTESAPLDKHAPVLCVVGGQGGAGATTLAAGLARTSASQGICTLLVDLDPYGGGIDLALGMESAAGDRWPSLAADPASLSSMLTRLPSRGCLRVLGPERDTPATPAPELVRRVLHEGSDGSEVIIVDVPRSLDPAATAALSAAHRTYLVAPGQLRAIAAANQMSRKLRAVSPDLQLVVRWPAPSGLNPLEVSRTLGIALAGVMRPEPGLSRDYERGIAPGQPRGPLGRLCAKLLDDLDIKPVRDAA